MAGAGILAVAGFALLFGARAQTCSYTYSGMSYSNDKYLGDLNNFDQFACENYCTNWQQACPSLRDSGQLGSYRVTYPCQTQCGGFTQHQGKHCTLFPANSKRSPSSTSKYFVKNCGYNPLPPYPYSTTYNPYPTTWNPTTWNPYTPAPTPPPAQTCSYTYSGMSYSNDKYLGDLSNFDQFACEGYCTNWQQVCPSLRDSGQLGSYRVTYPCQTQCGGFTQHQGKHCTLFPANSKRSPSSTSKYYVKNCGNTPYPPYPYPTTSSPYPTAPPCTKFRGQWTDGTAGGTYDISVTPGSCQVEVTNPAWAWGTKAYGSATPTQIVYTLGGQQVLGTMPDFSTINWSTGAIWSRRGYPRLFEAVAAYGLGKPSVALPLLAVAAFAVAGMVALRRRRRAGEYTAMRLEVEGDVELSPQLVEE